MNMVNNEYELPIAAQKWIEDAVGGNARVRETRRLAGGISSTVLEATVLTARGEERYVLRLHDNAEWLREEPDLARHEASALNLAASAGLSAPQAVAFDETGHACGTPAVLMTRLPGSVVLEPENRSCWHDGLAAALARIHAVPGDGFSWSYFPYKKREDMAVPDWASEPSLWAEAIAILQGEPAEFRACFIHRDYHPANVLWDGGSVSGIVDWVNACRGPAGVDVGHCRINLVQMFGIEAADDFLEAYVRHAGKSFRYDPYWDLRSLMDSTFGPPTVYAGWTALGMTGLTDALMAERLHAFLESVMRRACL